MNLKRRERQAIGLLILALLNSIGFAYLYILTNHYKVNPFFPQSTKAPPLQFSLDYPPPENGAMQEKWLSIQFALESDSTIAENVNLTFANVSGSTLFKSKPDIIGVNVGFYGARGTVTSGGYTNETTGETMMYSGLAGAYLHTVPNPHNPDIFQNLELVWDFTPTVSFPIAGDYSPSIIVNLGKAPPLIYTYSEIKVHVLSTSEIQAQELNFINAFVALALLAFSDVELFRLVYDWQNKAENKPKLNNTQNPQREPEQTMGYS